MKVDSGTGNTKACHGPVSSSVARSKGAGTETLEFSAVAGEMWYELYKPVKYLCRPSIAGKRVTEQENGRFRVALKAEWRNDTLQCPCGGRRSLVALIDQPPAIKKVLAHLGLATEALTKPEDPVWLPKKSTPGGPPEGLFPLDLDDAGLGWSWSGAEWRWRGVPMGGWGVCGYFYRDRQSRHEAATALATILTCHMAA